MAKKMHTLCLLYQITFRGWWPGQTSSAQRRYSTPVPGGGGQLPVSHSEQNTRPKLRGPVCAECSFGGGTNVFGIRLERNVDLLPPVRTLTGIQLTPQSRAVTGGRIHHILVHKMMLRPTEPSGQGQQCNSSSEKVHYSPLVL